MIRLYVVHGIGEGECFELEGDTAHIGRSPNNDIQIDEGSISRRHVKIVRSGDRYYVEDLNSTNGTFVNNQPINPGEQVEVEEGLPVAIGKILFSLGKPFDGNIEDIQDWVDFSKDLIETGRVLQKDKPTKIKRELDLIFRTTELLKQSMGLEKLLGEALDCLFSYFKTLDRGVILLLEPQTGKILDVITSIHQDRDETVMMYSRTIVNRVRQEGTAIMMSDTRQEEQQNLSDSMRLMQIKSVMCIPLVSGGQMRGVIYVDSVNKPVGFRKEDLLLLNALSGPLGLAIENASLHTILKKI
ncbi:MAG: FHA domain-containing protein [Thermodesulfobacteriota bacterium]